MSQPNLGPSKNNSSNPAKNLVNTSLELVNLENGFSFLTSTKPPTLALSSSSESTKHRKMPATNVSLHNLANCSDEILSWINFPSWLTTMLSNFPGICTVTLMSTLENAL